LAAIAAGPTVMAADAHPEGCVSCHVNREGDADFRLSQLLEQIGHPSVKRVRQVPRDCTRCHSTEDEDGEVSFSRLIHEIHYDVPKINLYVTRFGGNCLGCHEMDVEEGEAQVKNGAKNW
jgi:nitrate/TMAO reductase-like tetraheme cytochrome c subunit